MVNTCISRNIEPIDDGTLLLFLYLPDCLQQLASEAGNVAVKFQCSLAYIKGDWTLVLSEQLRKEEEGLQADADDLQGVTDLFGKGAVPMPRITDSRRALLLSSTRKLQTISQLMTTKEQRDEFSRNLERLNDQRKINLRQELEDAGVKLNQIRAKLQAVGEKLQYTGLVRSQLIRGARGKPQISIVRKGEKGWERFTAEEDRRSTTSPLTRLVSEGLLPKDQP